MNPSWRKPTGIALILMLIVVWVGLVASLPIGRLHWAAQAIVYLVAGVVWILPLKPLLRWMETGVWR